MPQSDPFNIPWVIRLIGQIKPKSILDIGIGTGAYGFLCRQYLDIAVGRIQKKEWETRIDGVEVFREYENPIWEHYYDKVILGDAKEIIQGVQNYDLILIIDVIEHFSKEEGRALLTRLLTKSDWVIITTPKGKFLQGELYGNVHETHLSEWSRFDFKGLCFREIGLDVSNLYVIAKELESLNRINLYRVPKLVYPARYIRSMIKNAISGFLADIYLRFTTKSIH